MASKKTSSNPFDAHYNRIKKNVVGRKITKSELGKPGQSRHQAFKKREKTLLQEYLRRDKAGKLVDKRLADQFGGSSKRKAKLFERRMKKSEAPTLTHAGQVLNERLEDRPDVDLLDDADDDLNLLRRPDYIEGVHFGGGDQVGEDNSGVIRSQAEFMKLMMSEKIKRQEEIDRSKELTNQLDMEFSNIRSLIAQEQNREVLGAEKKEESSKKVNESSESQPSLVEKVDKKEDEMYSDYDLLTRSLLMAKKQAKEEAKGITATTIAAKKAKKMASKEERDKAIDRLENEGIVILPLVSPRIETLRPKRSVTQSLKRKVKREKKAASRELRKDSSFLKSVWLKETMKRDKERNDKVKRILADISSDVHECRKIKKAKV